jgi:hypothetical protein
MEHLKRRKHRPKNHMTLEVEHPRGGGTTKDTTRP